MILPQRSVFRCEHIRLVDLEPRGARGHGARYLLIPTAPGKLCRHLCSDGATSLHFSHYFATAPLLACASRCVCCPAEGLAATTGMLHACCCKIIDVLAMPPSRKSRRQARVSMPAPSSTTCRFPLPLPPVGFCAAAARSRASFSFLSNHQVRTCTHPCLCLTDLHSQLAVLHSRAALLAKIACRVYTDQIRISALRNANRVVSLFASAYRQPPRQVLSLVLSRKVFRQRWRHHCWQLPVLRPLAILRLESVGAAGDSLLLGGSHAPHLQHHSAGRDNAFGWMTRLTALQRGSAPCLLASLLAESGPANFARNHLVDLIFPGHEAFFQESKALDVSTPLRSHWPRAACQEPSAAPTAGRSSSNCLVRR